MLIVWRIVKFIGIGALGAGSLAGLIRDPDDRARIGFVASTVGWLLTWTAGWGMVKSGSASMADPWVSAGMLFSFVGFIAAVGAAGAARPRFWTGVSLAGFVASIIVMSLKDYGMAHGVAVGVGMAVGVLAAALSRNGEAPDVVWSTRWFAVLAWLEGISLLALFGLFLPAKYGFHMEIDGGQGWFGWAHGMFVMGYVVALGLTSWRSGWSMVDTGMGFVASFFPFGTFWFERRLHARGLESRR